MLKLIYTNVRGESVELFGPPFRLISVEGLGDVDADIQTQKSPYQDGSTHIDTTLTERLISIEFKIVGNSIEEIQKYRKLISSVFNPKLGLGTLQYIGKGENKEIQALSEHVPYFPDGRGNRGRDYQKALIDLICPDPYWRDPRVISRALRAYQGRFTLPTTFPVELGIEGDTTILTNEGDTPAPITIDIQGPVTNPQVINKTTGKFIRVNLSLSENEVLHIDTGRPRRVEIYRDGRTIENAMGYIDHYSDFWELSVGPNEVQYIADAGNANAIVAVAWQNRYVGI